MAFAFLLAVEVKSMLIGEGLPPHLARRIRAAAEADPSVRRVIYMKTLVTGPEDALVAVKAEFDPASTAADIEAAVDRVEARVREVIPGAVCFIEPGRS
jgi:divalent metal cation (Fe/Co/Zn/Cd) transporter